MDPSEIDRTYNIRKQQTRFFFSLFMRTNGKCINSHAPKDRLKAVFCFPSEPNIPEGPECNIVYKPT